MMDAETEMRKWLLCLSDFLIWQGCCQWSSWELGSLRVCKGMCRVGYHCAEHPTCVREFICQNSPIRQVLLAVNSRGLGRLNCWLREGEWWGESFRAGWKYFLNPGQGLDTDNVQRSLQWVRKSVWGWWPHVFQLESEVVSSVENRFWGALKTHHLKGFQESERGRQCKGPDGLGPLWDVWGRSAQPFRKYGRLRSCRQISK